MDCFSTLCDKLHVVGTLQNDQRLAFHSDGSVNVVQQGVQNWNRKLLNRSAQSRETTMRGLTELIDLANDLSAGIMQLPSVVTDKSPLKSESDCADDLRETQPQNDNGGAQFLSKCNEREKENLLLLSKRLNNMCGGMNRMMNSTYAADNDFGAQVMHLINVAQLISQRINTTLAVG